MVVAEEHMTSQCEEEIEAFLAEIFPARSPPKYFSPLPEPDEDGDYDDDSEDWDDWDDDDDTDDDLTCSPCDGSGEGMHEGTVCRYCHGRGVLRSETEQEKAECVAEEAAERRREGGRA